MKREYFVYKITDSQGVTWYVATKWKDALYQKDSWKRELIKSKLTEKQSISLSKILTKFSLNRTQKI